MIRHLIAKDLHDHLLSLRAQVGVALAVALVAVSAFVLSTGYRRATTEYFERQHQEEAFLRQYAHLNRLGVMVWPLRPPAPLVLVRGLAPDAGVESLTSNPLPELFPPMDLSIIIGVVFSLLGIMLGYDAVNGEREQGTLRLVLANRLPRASVLAAKWAGGVIVLAVALALALAAGVLIVQLRAGVPWSSTEWLALGGAFTAGLLYGGLYFSLALMLSIACSRSSTSVLASLLVWALSVLVLPNLAPYVAAQLRPAPAVAAMERDIQYIISEQRDELGRIETAKLRERSGFTRADFAEETLQPRLATDPAFRARFERYRKDADAIWARVNQQQQAEAERRTNDWQARARAQFDLSQRLSYASPLPPLLYALSDLSGTGFAALKDFREQASAFRRALTSYARDRYAEELKRNPTYDVNDFMDLSGRPRFTYVPPGWPARFALVVPQLEALLLWNLAFLVAATVLFLRFDVR